MQSTQPVRVGSLFACALANGKRSGVPLCQTRKCALLGDAPMLCSYRAVQIATCEGRRACRGDSEYTLAVLHPYLTKASKDSGPPLIFLPTSCGNSSARQHLYSTATPLPFLSLKTPLELSSFIAYYSHSYIHAPTVVASYTRRLLSGFWLA